jgi:hypothetical protein
LGHNKAVVYLKAEEDIGIVVEGADARARMMGAAFGVEVADFEFARVGPGAAVQGCVAIGGHRADKKIGRHLIRSIVAGRHDNRLWVICPRIAIWHGYVLLEKTVRILRM